MVQVGTMWSPLNRFPLELWDYIIDIIADFALVYLLDCSLVCKDWYTRSRVHLLKSVKLQDEENAKALAELASTYTHFQVVERLTVYGSGVDGCRGSITHLFTIAKLLFPVLPSLVDLVLRNAEWSVSRGPQVDASIYGYLRSSSSIKRLHLDNVVITSNVVFARFVQALPYCEQVTFRNTRLGPNGMHFKRVAFDMVSLRGIFGELSDRRNHIIRQVEGNEVSFPRPSCASRLYEERLGGAIQMHASSSHSHVDPDNPFLENSNKAAIEESSCGHPAHSALKYVESEECQHLVEHLMTSMPLRLDNYDEAGQRSLAVVRAAMSSKQGIQAIKALAEAGFHRTVVNLLDFVLEDIGSAPQSRLYTTVFHTLRKMCVKYGDVPDSLILPQHSIVLLSDRHRPQEKGGFADIYIGRWMNQVVGIKTFRISGSEAIETMMTDIAKEATLWRRLDHPNVVPFYGLDKDHFELSMVCKWMQNGHIVKFLGKNPSASRLQTIMDIARGLEYLHSEHVGIIHGDLKGVNILIDEHGRACLSDFGLSTVMYDCHTLNTITQISNFSSSLRWTAPEILDPEKFGLSSAVPSREGDVYAFAMVMWEVFTGKVPFPDARPNGKVVRIITSGTRPDYPVEAVSLGLSDGVWSVMKECWAADPTMRPTISQAIASLEAEWFSDVVSTA